MRKYQKNILCGGGGLGHYNRMRGLAENLRAARRAAGLSQAQLAKRAGVSQQLISGIENSRLTKTNQLPEIATALGLKPGDLDDRFDVDTEARKQIEVIRALAINLDDDDLDDLVELARRRAERATRR